MAQLEGGNQKIETEPENLNLDSRPYQKSKTISLGFDFLCSTGSLVTRVTIVPPGST